LLERRYAQSLDHITIRAKYTMPLYNLLSSLRFVRYLELDKPFQPHHSLSFPIKNIVVVRAPFETICTLVPGNPVIAIEITEGNPRDPQTDIPVEVAAVIQRLTSTLEQSIEPIRHLKLSYGLYDPIILRGVASSLPLLYSIELEIVGTTWSANLRAVTQESLRTLAIFPSVEEITLGVRMGSLTNGDFKDLVILDGIEIGAAVRKITTVDWEVKGLTRESLRYHEYIRQQVVNGSESESSWVASVTSGDARDRQTVFSNPWQSVQRERKYRTPEFDVPFSFAGFL